MDPQPSAQSPFQKLNVDNNCQKHAKLDITFLRSCPILLYFLTFCQILCPGLQMRKIMKGMKYENVNLMHKKICQWKSATEIRRNQINLNTVLNTQIQRLSDSIIRIMQSNLIDWLYKMITQCLFKVLKRHISFTFLQKVTKILLYLNRYYRIIEFLYEYQVTISLPKTGIFFQNNRS